MGMTVRECVTLQEYLRQVLGTSQAEVAKRAGCDQSWVSMVFNGRLPKRGTRTWDGLVRALSLIGQEDQFTRMVQNGARVKALKKHISADFPLALFASPGESGRVIGLDIVRDLRTPKPGKAVRA
ncbi:MAG: helix-turn-helix domain-containing protein [Planctomycetota bacterium]|nr:helix-turn-helix domain-containing protein [Planctomycetota bacterium]